MTAGDQQQQVRKGRRIAFCEACGQGMALQMVHREEWDLMGRCDGLCGHDADKDAADQAGSASRRDAIQFGKIESGFGQGLFDQVADMIQMAARRDFGHHAAEGPVLVELRQHLVGQNAPIFRHKGGSGLVAAGFESQ